MSLIGQAIIEAEENGTLVFNEETSQYEEAQVQNGGRWA